MDLSEDLSEGAKSSRISFGLPKKPVLKLSEVPESLAPVDWGPNRPRPILSHGLWKNEEAEELEKYIDWHKNHPHCITPRKIVDDLDGKLIGRQKLDPENPGKFYTGNGIKVAPIPKTFLPTKLGVEGSTDEVSVTAWRNEYGTLVQQAAEDPWFVMSVKDQLEQSHMDGSHTTVKFKQPKKTDREARLEKQKSWAKTKFEDYEGGLHPHTGEHARMLEKLAYKDKANIHDAQPKVKVGPWAETYTYSQFTKNGTALKSFEKNDLEVRVDKALALHIEEVKNNVLGSSSTKSSKSSKSKRSSKKSKKEAIKQADPYEVMKEKMGGPKAMQKMEKGWLKMAKNIRKYSNKRKNEIDLKLDLVDACEKLRVLKVSAILLSGEGHVDMKTPEDEPLFLYTVAKAVKMDTITNSLRPEDEDQDTADRKKIQKILNLLIKYGADVNMTTGKDQVGAIHIAAAADNSKMVRWLASQKANVNLFTKTSDRYTSLMIAAKYCYVYVMAELVRSGCEINLPNPLGYTALHISGAFGQSRSALFLLRVGADKKLQDEQQRTAARVAEDNRFMGTAQTIASFTPAMKDYKVQLQYMLNEHEQVLNKQQSLDEHFNSFLDNMFDGAMQLFHQGTSLLQPVTNFFKKRVWSKFRKLKIFPMLMGTEFEEGDDDDDDDSEAGQDGAVMDGAVEDLDAQLQAMEARHKKTENPETIQDMDGFEALDEMKEW